MGLQSGFADGGPAAALAAVARRLGRQVDHALVRERFFLHDSPHSLKALVEIAAEVGLEARAFRADPANLGEVELPAVVHLVDPRNEENGFAVLLECREEEYVLEEGAVPATHVLTSREFVSWWTGVLVTFVAVEGAAAPKLKGFGAFRRLRQWILGGDLSDPANEFARKVAGAAVVVLALATAARVGMVQGSTLVGLATLAAVGLAIVGVTASRVLYFVSRRAHIPAAAPRLATKICKRGTHVDCDGVLSSRYASVLGVDLSSLGLAFFASNLILLAAAAVFPAEAARPLLSWLAVAHLIAVPESFWLIAVQVYPLRRFCPLCMVTHACVLITAALGAAWLLGPGGDVGMPGVLGFSGLHVAAYAVAFGVLVPFLGLGMEVRSHRTRLGWIGATPWGALAEMIGRPGAVSNLPDTPLRIGEPSAPFRLDALVHPFCPGCGPVVEKIERLVERHRALLRGEFHVPPRDLMSRGDLDLCAALYATARVAGGAEGVAFFREAKQKPWGVLAEVERDVRGVLRGVLGERPGVEAALEESRADVRAADALYEAVQRGTPAVLLNGKPWESSLEDLDALLSRYPDLLAGLLRIAPRPESPVNG